MENVIDGTPNPNLGSSLVSHNNSASGASPNPANQEASPNPALLNPANHEASPIPGTDQEMVSDRLTYMDIRRRNPNMAAIWGLWIDYEESAGEMVAAKQVTEQALHFCANECKLWARLIKLADKGERVEVLSRALKENWGIEWHSELYTLLVRTDFPSEPMPWFRASVRAEADGNVSLAKVIMRIALKFQADILPDGVSWINAVVESERMGSSSATVETALTAILPKLSGEKRIIWVNIAQHLLDNHCQTGAKVVTNLLTVEYPLDDNFLKKMLQFEVEPELVNQP